MSSNRKMHIPSLVPREADLSVCPHYRENDCRHIAVGDLHGNALKLIYTMIEEGVLELSVEDYNRVRVIYNKAVDDLTKDDLEQFKVIIQSAKVNSEKSVTLIGDELADRGNNDYFTLLVLQKLHAEQLDLDILLSNHGIEFIRDYERVRFTGRSTLVPGQARSLANLHRLIERGLIQEDYLRLMVDECYKPRVKAIGYTVSKSGGISLFTHAPVGFETIKALARKTNIAYNDETREALICTIRGINEKIKERFSHKDLDIEDDPNDEFSRNVPVLLPLRRLTWNRAIGDELETAPSGNFHVGFVHGHTGPGVLKKEGHDDAQLTHMNLDANFGKWQGYEKTGEFNSPEGSFQITHLTRHSTELTQQVMVDYLANRLATIKNKWSFNLNGGRDVALADYVAEKVQALPNLSVHDRKTLANALDDLEKISSLINDTLTTLKGRVIFWGVADKTKKIIAAMQQLTIEERCLIAAAIRHPERPCPDNVREVVLALASRRIGGPTDEMQRARFDEDKAAASFSHIKKKLGSAKIANSDPVDVPKDDSATPPK